MKLIIFTIMYFFLSPMYVLADAREGLAGTAEAGWIGPLSAVILITSAIIIAKKIKKTKDTPEPTADLLGDNK